MTRTIPLLYGERATPPPGATCQEASPQSHDYYIPCGAPAVWVVKNADQQPYAMCSTCAYHNVRNRDGHYVMTSESFILARPDSEGVGWKPWSQKKPPRRPAATLLDDAAALSAMHAGDAPRITSGPLRKSATKHAASKIWELPTTLGACADALYATRADRLALEKQAEDLKLRERMIKDYIIDTLPKSDAEGVAGHVARVTITKRQIPSVVDWDKLYAYVRKTKDFSLLQRRLADAAIAERWDDGKEVPGVDRFTLVGVSVTKL